MDPAQRLDDFVNTAVDLASAVQAGREALLKVPALVAENARLQLEVADLRARLQAVVRTRWGSSIWVWPGETKPQALARTQKAIGPLEVVRHFAPGIPVRPTWTGDLPLHISFKAPPAEVLTGRHDAALRAFFPTLRDGEAWTWQHEPEDDIERGEFTAQQFRDGWRRIAAIARTSGRRLLAVPVLMEWTLQAASSRNWRDYYPGDDVVDALGWDAYLLKGRKISDVFTRPRAIAAETGKPYLIAETGVADDQVPAGMTRAQALTALARDLATVAPRPLSVTYFDAPVGANSKLWPISRDAAASAAWVAGRT